MAIAFVQGAGNIGSGSTTTVTVNLNGVVAGNLLVIGVTWTYDRTITSISDGTSSFMLLPRSDPINTNYSQLAYLLAANAGDKVFTCTFSAAAGYPVIMISEFSGGDWAYDTDARASAQSATISVGPITTSSPSSLIILRGGLWNVGRGLENVLIGPNVATQEAFSPYDNYNWMFYDIPGAQQSNIYGSGDFSGSTDWSFGIAAFKLIGGGSIVPLISAEYRRRFN